MTPFSRSELLIRYSPVTNPIRIYLMGHREEVILKYPKAVSRRVDRSSRQAGTAGSDTKEDDGCQWGKRDIIRSSRIRRMTAEYARNEFQCLPASSRRPQVHCLLAKVKVIHCLLHIYPR